MKLFLISLGITFVLIVTYLMVGVVVVIATSPDQSNLNPSAIAMVDVPFRGPKLVYYYFFPPNAEDFSTNPSDLGLKKAVLAVGFFVANLMLYSIPVYLLLRFGRRPRKRKHRDALHHSPPSPPQF